MDSLNPASIQSQPQEKPKQKPLEPYKTHLRPTLWIMTLIVIAFAAGYLVWAKSNQAWPFDNEIVGLPTHQIAQNNNNSATAGWKTYTNSQLGFELKFPPHWAAMKVEANGLDFDLPYVDTKQFSFVCGIEDYTEKQWQDLENSEGNHPDFITQQDGVVYAYNCGQDDYGFVGFEDYNLQVKQKGYGGGKAGPYAEFKSLVIPTFKFIEPVSQVDTSSWKTYTNNQYGFEVKYPKEWNFKEDFSNQDGFFVTDPSGKAFVAILPKGEFDYGIEEIPKITTIVFANLNAKQLDYKSGIRQIEFLTPPAGWSAANRLEIHLGNQSDTLNQILSTFKFIN